MERKFNADMIDIHADYDLLKTRVDDILTKVNKVKTDF